MTALAERLAAVRERIRQAAETAGREPSAVRILAVTKGHPASTVTAAVDLGLTEIGESRVQEARGKHAELHGRGIRWHLVGHLQRNKARVAAGIFDAVHSVDGVPVAVALDRHRGSLSAPLRVLIEVELTGLPGRSGVAPEAAASLLADLAPLPHLDTAGLMTIAPPGAPDAARDCFRRLRELRDELRSAGGLPLDELSMGMSDDFEIAVAEGATVLRLGRVLFGERRVGL